MTTMYLIRRPCVLKTILMDFTSVNIKKIEAIHKKTPMNLYNTIISILLIQTKKAFNISIKITLKNIISVPTF